MLCLKLFNFASVLLFDTLNLNSMVRNGLGQFFLGSIKPPLQVAFVPGMLRLKLLNLSGVLLPDTLQVSRMTRSGFGQFIPGLLDVN
ncbi:hypothetical protein [Escherichia coli]|uniref:hypothetical protein n=1 Tax=Escherichia coli TaxID=562 RepID=UPI00197E6177|nr:hypothetical protein [Escherichia coli]